MNIETIQAAIREAGFDGWLFYDHHHRDPIAGHILGLDEKAMVTRRWYYFVPASGEPRKLVHRIEQGRLDTLPGAKAQYSSWQEIAAGLEAMLFDAHTVAMQYSHNNDIMYVSMVDAGTVEFLRGLDKQIVSSADLVSQFEAVLTEEQKASHGVAQRAIDAIVAAGWKEIGRRLRPAAGQPQRYTEFDHSQWLGQAMRREGLVWDSGPDVSVNANSSDSHYEATAEHSSPIREGDLLLVDIWAKADQPGSVYYDITWTGVVGREPSEPSMPSRAPLRRAVPSAALRPTTRPAPSSKPPASGSSSPIAPATTSSRSCMARARTSTIWKPTTSGCCCPILASRSNPASTCRSSAYAAKSTC
jgi:Xaa-Pro aminopeptidase